MELLCSNATEYRNGMEIMLVCQIDDTQCDRKYCYWCPTDKCMKNKSNYTECSKLNNK